ncbi:MAG: hypothetical protein ACR2ND_10995 [Solirubrobacteraceae bacterium]
MHRARTLLWVCAGLLLCALWTTSLVYFVGPLGSAAIVVAVALLGVASGALDRATGRSSSNYR